MIPTVLLITIINQRSSNPFPTYIETLVILVLFEIIREAALRKPNVVGDSMTIVGSLIIGQTIVEAGLFLIWLSLLFRLLRLQALFYQVVI